ncbi:hypothetical protein [Photobacterium kasasachensis]|uniref:hypothetical protein n=1 Tax=Photobacterium kasasachensis TaxID=2910240 RepID=UPI003D105BE5
MKKIITIILLSSLVGCVSNSIETEAANNTVSTSNKVEKEVVKETSDPLSKIQYFEVTDYLTNVFPSLRSMLVDKYSNDIYISKPQAYVVDSEILAIAPWFPTPTEYTVFPTAHYAIVTKQNGSDFEGLQYDMKDMINLLSEKYDVKESSQPFFHYVLHLTPQQRDTFEEDIYVALSELTEVQ